MRLNFNPRGGMNTRTIVMAAVVLSVGLSACGTTTPGNDAGTGGGSATGGGSGSTGGGSGSTGGGSGGNAATCATYCTTIMANCTGGNAQYPSQESCLGACSAMTQGTIGAMSGNSLECHAYHAAAAPTNAAVHCPHAGPSGDGACGTNCDNFCGIAMSKCSSAFADLAACTTACAAFANADVHYNSGLTTGNNFACRMYHLSVAATNSGSATTHCPHTQATSSTCN